jgi:hypothetical protein
VPKTTNLKILIPRPLITPYTSKPIQIPFALPQKAGAPLVCLPDTRYHKFYNISGPNSRKL